MIVVKWNDNDNDSINEDNDIQWPVIWNIDKW